MLPSIRDIKASLLWSTRHWPFNQSIDPNSSEVDIADQLAHKARHWHWRRLLSYRTPPSQWQSWLTIHPDEFKKTSISSNGCNWPLDTGEVVTAHLTLSIHGKNLESTESYCHTRRVTDIEDEDHEYKHSYKSIECHYWPTHLQWTDCPYPWMPQYGKPKVKSRDDFKVNTVMTTMLLFERSAPIPVCVYTNSSSNLAEAFYSQPRDILLKRRISTEEDLSTNQALLVLGTSARAKCPYVGDPLQWKHFYCHEHLHKWSGLTERTPYNWRTVRMRSFSLIDTNSSQRYIAQREVHLRIQTDTSLETNYDDYNDHRDYDYLRAQVLCTIKAAIVKSNTNGDSGRKW